nr:EOG090X02IK [Lepidurus arcticus]
MRQHFLPFVVGIVFTSLLWVIMIYFYLGSNYGTNTSQVLPGYHHSSQPLSRKHNSKLSNDVDNSDELVGGWKKNLDFKKNGLNDFAVKASKCFHYYFDTSTFRLLYMIHTLLRSNHYVVQSKFGFGQIYIKYGDVTMVEERRKYHDVMCFVPIILNSMRLQCSIRCNFCRATYLLPFFRALTSAKECFPYRFDVTSKTLLFLSWKKHLDRLSSMLGHLSPLQSWAPEMRYFTNFSQNPFEADQCDEVIEEPTYIMKIDASVNMYHHFCDFFNLYASLHLNGTHLDMFSRNRRVLIWETFPYYSNFALTWSAFTRHQPWNLRVFQGKRVCFKEALFPLLPRMIYGLFYNTPLVWGCESSGLFHAFSQFVLTRLHIPWPNQRPSGKVYITLLSRDTQYRRILNEDQLLLAIQSNPNYVIQKAVFTHLTDFRQQLTVIQQTDILIGMHGAGLTHLLFLPDWAAVFELYNCEDDGCYSDLARLRGVKYLTWRDKSKLKAQDSGHHPSGGGHAKFTNYNFNVDEFSSLVEEAADHVLKHPLFPHGSFHRREEL